MRATARATSVLSSMFVLIAIAIGLAQTPTQTPPQATPQPGSFAGRWEISVRPPGSPAAAGLGPDIPFAIVELSGSGSAVSAKLIDSMGAPVIPITLTNTAVKGDQLELSFEMKGQKSVFSGKRVEDRIEGTATADGDSVTWIARTTTKDKLPDLMSIMEQQAANTPPDQKAYDAAMDIPGAAEREIALKKFQADYPNSSLKDSATLQIALTKTAPYKAAAIQYFIDAAPAGQLKEQAEYELTKTLPAGRNRIAAEEAFIGNYPKSAYRSSIYNSWLDAASGKNVDESRLTKAIDGLLDTAPDRPVASAEYTINFRSMTLNDIADKLMKREVMLDRALALIQEAVKLDGDKAEPDSRAIHTTTLGQVLFKLKRYDEAGDALKKAVEISGHDGDGETQLFLGKFYEVKKQDDLALEAYLKATDKGSPLDTKASLEKLYLKRYGTLATLEKTLDEKYRARGVGFDPGHYARPAAAGPARVALAELFTGAECGPCVSADLAFDGLGERYRSSDIAVLVYHLHIPAPDALANADTVARAKYYAVDATPTAVFDGLFKSSGGGGRSSAPESFAEYTNIIEKRMATNPLASLDNLKADLNGNMISVNGEAALLPEAADRAGRVTLHVALAENDIKYLGSNGIRFHNLVVRKLFDGPQGTSFDVSKSIAAVAVSLDLATVGTQLADYLASYENTKRTKFKDRPTTLNLSKLVVVAFVQDDKTKEVLQAVVITPGVK